jgi:hypothetical protein
VLSSNLELIKKIAATISPIALAVIWTAWPKWALDIQDSEDTASPLGVAFGQTLELNVASTGRYNTIPVVNDDIR